MAKDYQEWFLQSDYDFQVAETLFRTEKYIYCVFLCHLSVEKYLKGIYLRDLQKEPPKFHSLGYFIDACELRIPENMNDYILEISDMAVLTRYPDSLVNLKEEFEKNVTQDLLNKTQEFLKWLKTEYTK